MLILSAMVFATATTVSIPSFAANELTTNVPQVYERRSRADAIDAALLYTAERRTPPPCPVALASEPMPVPAPPEADGGVTWLARTQGASRPRRPLRNSVEKKDGNPAT